MNYFVRLITILGGLFCGLLSPLYCETHELLKSTNLDIAIEPGKFWFHQFKIMGLFSITAEPQIAVWLEDENGRYLKTIYITAKYSSQGFWGNKTRPESLPVWKAKYDSSKEETIDAVSKATGTVLKGQINEISQDKKYFLLLEINNSFDFNEFYQDDLSSSHPDYSATSGQPALIYKSLFDSKKTTGLFELTGHSHPAGKDGRIYTDLAKVTTAKQIAKSIVWKIK